MRPGVARDDVSAVRERLVAGDRVVEFEMEPVAISSSEIRARIARDEPVDDVLPPPVSDAISRLGLYVPPE